MNSMLNNHRPHVFQITEQINFKVLTLLIIRVDPGKIQVQLSITWLPVDIDSLF